MQAHFLWYNGLQMVKIVNAVWAKGPGEPVYLGGVMIKSVEDFGNFIEKMVVKSPEKARRWLLLGYQFYGLKLRWFPDRRLPSAKRKVAVDLNRTVQKLFKEPDNIALVNIFMPCEILEAMDMVPMCAELLAGFINGTYSEGIFAEEAQKEGIAETYCSYHKIFLGTAYTRVLPPPKAIINTSFACDANNLTFQELATQMDIPHYYIDVPYGQSEESVQQVAAELREATAFLEEVSGKRLDEEKLKAAVGRSQKSIELFRQILEKKRDLYLPGDVTSEMYEVYLVHNGLGTAMCYDYAKTFLDDFKRAKAFTGIKILWLHVVPHWQKPVIDLFDFNEDCQIIACDMNFENLVDLDPEKPYESMARRLVYSHWSTGQSRIDKAVEMGKYLQVDGVICFCQWGCKQTLGLADLFKEAFEAEGMPLLVLDGDGADRRNAFDGQVSTRLNAFVEMLKGRKYGG